jgi:phage terminase large subunit-like protein
MVSKLDRLSEEQLGRLSSLHRQELVRRSNERPADFFPWHPIQDWILQAPGEVDGDTRIILIAGGNRGGKSKVAMGIISQLLRRESPLNEQLLTIDKFTGEIVVKDRQDPLTIWVVPPTLEKARQDWLTPQDGYGLKHWCGSLYIKLTKTPDLMIFSRPPGLSEKDCYGVDGKLNEEKLDKILIKSQDQRLETFESSEVDLVVFDEEVQDEKIWNSCRMRVGTTHGTIVMAYTPLHGLSWSFKGFWKPLVKEGRAVKVQDRCWISNPTPAGTEGPENVICAQMGSADNPRARSYAKEIEHSRQMGEAEKAARLHGEYGYVEGALIKALGGLDVASPLPEHEPYVVDLLPGFRVPGTDKRVDGRLTNWFLVSDPNKSYGATLSALDANGNLFFLSEHLEEALPDRLHADAFKAMERDFVRGPVHRYADPGSAGAQSIVNMESLGIPFDTMPKGAGSVSASIKKLRGLTFIDPKHQHPVSGKMGAPRVYFYRPGLLTGGKTESQLAAQISEARQTDNEDAPPDTPHKSIRSRLDLFDCARYTAVVSADIPISKGTPDLGIGVEPDEDTLRMGPKIAELDPFEQEFYIPEYEFH